MKSKIKMGDQSTGGEIGRVEAAAIEAIQVTSTITILNV